MSCQLLFNKYLAQLRSERNPVVFQSIAGRKAPLFDSCGIPGNGAGDRARLVNLEMMGIAKGIRRTLFLASWAGLMLAYAQARPERTNAALHPERPAAFTCKAGANPIFGMAIGLSGARRTNGSSSIRHSPAVPVSSVTIAHRPYVSSERGSYFLASSTEASHDYSARAPPTRA